MKPHPTRVVLAAAAAYLAILAPSLAQAKVHITVDLDAQTIHVDAKSGVYDWKVSSGKTGYDTPAGQFNVLWMDKDHHSDEYEQAYMPNAIFFAPGFAIHGFSKSPWGHKASHGCVRLPMDKSAMLFDMVKTEGADIAITGASKRVAPTVASIRQKQRDQEAADATQNDVPQGYADQGYARPSYASQGYASQGYASQDADEDGYAAQRPTRQAPARNGSLFGSFY